MKRTTNNETAALLRAQDRFLLLTHDRPDGDTLGAAAALAMGLRALGKTAYLLPNPGAGPKYDGFLPPLLAAPDFAPDFVVAVDVASAAMLPENAAPYAARVDLCIDHHPSNTGYAAHTCLAPECAACGEIVYALLSALDAPLTREIADALYVAVSTDTGCFAYANTTADTLRIAAALVTAGADSRRLNKLFFRTKSRARIAVEGRLLSGMTFYRGGQIAVTVLTQAMRRETGAAENDLDDIASLPSQIEGVLAGVLVRENADGTCRVSVRTSGGVSANRICAAFGGGGHEQAAGCNVDASAEETVQRVLAAAEQELE